jgi:hypothetical protein
MTLIKHIRNYKGEILATVVATEKNKIGFVVKHPREKNQFPKKFAVEIASKRATASSLEIERYLDRISGGRSFVKEKEIMCGGVVTFTRNLRQVIEEAIMELEERSVKYFKEK